METSWTTLERGRKLTLIHDNRWLMIIGIPIGIVGLGIAIGPWLIESARTSDAWPILIVGSLIGLGFVVAGLSLCFKYEEFIANRSNETLTQNIGLPPFRRTKEWSLKQFEEVACVDEHMGGSSGAAPSTHHRLRLIGPEQSVLIASDLETETILFEAERWSGFLELPLRNRMGESRAAQLKESLNERRAKSN